MTTGLPTRALTLHRPWPWAIFGLPEGTAKRVENRGWKPPHWLMGQHIWIHAGKGWDDGADESITEIAGLPAEPEPGSVPAPVFHPAGLIGTVRVIGCVDIEDRDAPALVAADVGDWFCGPFGWLLDDVRPLYDGVHALACPGAQGIWTVPDRVLAQVPADFWQDG